MKVYVIEVGEYSDRHVVAVVETEAEAESICKAMRGIGVYAKDVRYTEFDTKTIQTYLLKFEVVEDDGEWTAEYNDFTQDYDLLKINYVEYQDHYIIYSSTPERAIKIAQDMKAEIEARKAEVAL